MQPGDVAWVVMVHGGGADYEIEFVTLAGETVSVVPCRRRQCVPCGRRKSHARGWSDGRAKPRSRPRAGHLRTPSTIPDPRLALSMPFRAEHGEGRRPPQDRLFPRSLAAPRPTGLLPVDCVELHSTRRAVNLARDFLTSAH